MSSLLEPALLWQTHGYSVVPVSSDGSKRPAIQWKKYQTERADAETLELWFANWNSDYGLGVVTGAVSGNLEMFEAEGRAVREGLVPQLAAAMTDLGEADLWVTLTGGYTELTPSGGIHWYYRVDGPARKNTKLARRPSTDAELAAHPEAKLQVLMETRGEGGYTVLAPTPGTHHHTGRGWTVLAGSPVTIPTITAAQRDTLYAVATMFDAMPSPVAAPEPIEPIGGSSKKSGGLRPGDDYNARASWSEILVGWTRVRRLGTGWAWRRPGKEDHGISATTGTRLDIGDNLYVFSTSTEFESERSYDKFGAYAQLNHGGTDPASISTAGRALAGRGFGDKRVGLPKPKSAPVLPAGSNNGHASGSLFDVPTGPPPPPPPDAAPDGGEGDEFLPLPEAYTESSVAEAFAGLISGQWNWCPELGWQNWCGTHWQARSEPDVVETARCYLKNLWLAAIARLAEASTAGAGEDQLKALQNAVGACRVMQSKAKGEAVAKYTRGQEGIRVEAEGFDADPELLNCGNGVVNLRTGDLIAHDPVLLMRKFTATAYHPGAVHSDWQTALGAVVDDETRYWLRILFGAAATGYVFDEDIVPFFFGEGENGKSTVLGGVRFALGSYAVLIMPRLLGGKGSDHETYIMSLLGARLAYLEELPRGHVLDMARIKQISGTAEITGRYLYQNQLTFRATHLLAVNTNYPPVVADVDHGTWRRLLSIPWPFSFDKSNEARDKGLRERVHFGHSQQEAVLAWVVSGAHEWLTADRSSPPLPNACVQHTEEWRHDNDTIGNFLSKNTAPAESWESPMLVTDLMERFNGAQGSGAVPWQMRTFVGRLRSHPFMLDRKLSVTKPKSGGYRDQLVIYGLKFAHTQPDLGKLGHWDRGDRP